MGEVDVAFFGMAGLAHHGDLIATLHRDIAFMVREFRDRNNALGLVANVNDYVLRRHFQHRSGDDLFFVQRGFGLSLFLLEGFEGVAKSSMAGSFSERGVSGREAAATAG